VSEAIVWFRESWSWEHCICVVTVLGRWLNLEGISRGRD
jgi:hypothetical protein